MKKPLIFFILSVLAVMSVTAAEQRRPIDSRHPLWLVHIDVWNTADPQKIIDMVPEDIRPYVCMNLSMSCQWDEDRGVYKMPQDAVQTYKSWATVCQHNGLWFMCQPASGGRTHLMDDDLDTFEYFFKNYPNFLGWNYAEQFWGFNDSERASTSDVTRIALFAKLVEMSHKYGGFLTVSFCGNIWSHHLSPNGMLKRNSSLLNACKKYPEAILWLYKYTTSSCWYNNESVTISPFISGLANNYGVRYDNCGWNGGLGSLFGDNNGHTYPGAAGISAVMEQSCVNGGAVWDGPELIWTEDFKNEWDSQSDGYTRHNWTTYPNFDNIWIDMWRKIIDGSLYIPTRQEVVEKTKIAVVADQTSGSDEDKYVAWGDLYDGLYKQDDPFNKGNGQWMDNLTWFKKTGRYATIPVILRPYDDLSKAIPKLIIKSERNTVWPTVADKVAMFDEQYPEVSTGDLYVSRYKNQLITYTPYSYLNANTTATGSVSLQYNTCRKLQMTWGKLSSAAVREYADHIDFYLNNYRNDSIMNVVDKIVITGASSKPSYTINKRVEATCSETEKWDGDNGKYTLEVTHNGPVDLSIKCSGASTNRKTDYLPDNALTDDMPVMPQAYCGPVIIEAEDMDFKSIGGCIRGPYGERPKARGYSGNGFIETGKNTAGGLRHKINMHKAGEYKIVVKYNSTKKAGELDVVVNGSTLKANIEKTATNQWLKTSVDVALKEGENTLLINNTAGIDMMIDYIVYMPKDTPTEKFKITVKSGSHGTATPNVTEAAEGDIVTFDIKADEGYSFAGWEYHPRQHPYFKDNTMQMPNDNVILTPVFKEGSAEPDNPDTPSEDSGLPEGMRQMWALDFTDVPDGALPEGWVCMQNGDEVHDYPNTYGSGSRTFEGFTGFQGKGLYWRTKYAQYGRQSDYLLTLEPGNYYLQFNMAAWKSSPQFFAQILNASDESVMAKSETYDAEPNANGDKAADLSATEVHGLNFNIQKTGNYVISFDNANEGDWHEFLLMSCKLFTDVQTGIHGITLDSADDTPAAIYGEDGRERTSLRHGINIVRMKSGNTRKIFLSETNSNTIEMKFSRNIDEMQ